MPMNATFTVTFTGFPDKFAARLERMLRDDIAGYPARLSMASASVTASFAKRKVPRAQVKEVVAHGKS